jgi:hypothetical protein
MPWSNPLLDYFGFLDECSIFSGLEDIIHSLLSVLKEQML